MPKKDWKSYERHPESAEYPDVPPRVLERMTDRLKRYGIWPYRTIKLREGKVWDGWQLYKACLAADVQPEFDASELPDGMDLGEAVEIANDLRRHEGHEEIARRAEERRQRVTAARADGQSIRAIAENEGVSVGTVQRDLAASGVSGDTPEAKNSAEQSNGATEPPKTTGKDGKSYPAKKGKKLCERCERIAAPYGIKDCTSCADLRAKPKGRQPGEDDAPLGSDGKPLPKKKPGKPVFDDGKVVEAFGKLARLLNDRALAYGLKDTPAPCKQAFNALSEAFKEWQKT